MADALSIEEQNGTSRVVFTAPVTRENVGQVSATARKVLKCNRRIILDLKHLQAHDSYALAVILEILHGKLHRQCSVEIENASAEVRSMLDRLMQAALRDGRQQQQNISFFERVGTVTFTLGGDVRQMIGFILEVLKSFLHALKHPRQVRWQEVIVYADRCGTEGLPIVLLICFLMGLILGFQAAIQLRVFGAEIYVADLVGLSICKELGPLMVATICTGRAGSAFAAEIGTMKVSEEVDALFTMGINPHTFLVMPRIMALVLVMPLLTVFGNIAGVAGGFTVAFLQLDIPMVAYWNQTVKALGPLAIIEGLVKSSVFAVLIAGIGCLRGMRTRGGAQGVGAATTSAVVSGIFMIIVSDAILTYFFSRLSL